VIHTKSTEDYGVGFQLGYHYPFVYWVENLGRGSRRIDQSEQHTTDLATMRGRAISWPLPRTDDFWYECQTAKRYFVDGVQVVASLRNTPIIIQLDLKEAPSTDIIYQVPIPNLSDPTGYEPGHWSLSHMVEIGHWTLPHFV
jgi:hypothetical protein